MELQNLSQDEQKALQERIKNMSPEELREFQKQQCLFCQIIHGKVNARRIFDDDRVVAILDINPANLGHVLLLPREHYQIMPQMDDDEVSHLFNIAKGISGAMLRAFQVQGTNIFVANGATAGQKAMHVMVHIIPRSGDDKINLSIPEFQISEQNMAIIHKRILEFMTSDLGMQPEKAETESPQEILQEEVKPETQAKTGVEEQQKEESQIKQTAQTPKVVEAEFREVKKKTQEKKEPSKRKFGEGMNIDDLADQL